MDANIITLFYNIIDFREYNSKAYEDCVKATDNVLQSLEQNPLRPIGAGQNGTYVNGEFLRADDLEHINSSMNTSNYNVNILGNINVRTTETINLTLGGSYYTRHSNDFSYRGSLLNYDKNRITDNTTYRGYIKFTQRFQTDPESTGERSLECCLPRFSRMGLLPAGPIRPGRRATGAGGAGASGRLHRTGSSRRFVSEARPARISS